MTSKGAKVDRMGLITDDDTARVTFIDTDTGLEISIYTWQYDILLAKTILDKNQIRMLYTFLGNLLGVDNA